MSDSKPIDLDSDYIQDFREAASQRREIEGEDWEEMERQDAEARAMAESEFSHTGRDCLFCRSGTFRGDLSRWLAHMTDGAEGLEGKSVAPVAASPSLLEGVDSKDGDLYSMLGRYIMPYLVGERARSQGLTRAQCTVAVYRATMGSLARLLGNAVPRGLLRLAEGEPSADPVAGSEAFCALLGYVVSNAGLPAARRFAENMGLFSLS